MNKELKLQEVKIGSFGADGDYRKTYRFKGIQVAWTRNHRAARSRDDRGQDKTLYQVGEDKYIVHILNWTHWQGEHDNAYFHSLDDEEGLSTPIILTSADVTAIFPDLANEAEISAPTDLDL